MTRTLTVWFVTRACRNCGEDCGMSVLDGPSVGSEGRMPHADAARIVARYKREQFSVEHGVVGQL